MKNGAEPETKEDFIKNLMQKPQKLVCTLLHEATKEAKKLQAELEEERRKYATLEKEKVELKKAMASMEEKHRSELTKEKENNERMHKDTMMKFHKSTTQLQDALKAEKAKKSNLSPTYPIESQIPLNKIPNPKPSAKVDKQNNDDTPKGNIIESPPVGEEKKGGKRKRGESTEYKKPETSDNSYNNTTPKGSPKQVAPVNDSKTRATPSPPIIATTLLSNTTRIEPIKNNQNRSPPITSTAPRPSPPKPQNSMKKMKNQFSSEEEDDFDDIPTEAITLIYSTSLSDVRKIGEDDSSFCRRKMLSIFEKAGKLEITASFIDKVVNEIKYLPQDILVDEIIHSLCLFLRDKKYVLSAQGEPFPREPVFVSFLFSLNKERKQNGNNKTEKHDNGDMISESNNEDNHLSQSDELILLIIEKCHSLILLNVEEAISNGLSEESQSSSSTRYVIQLLALLCKFKGFLGVPQMLCYRFIEYLFKPKNNKKAETNSNLKNDNNEGMDVENCDNSVDNRNKTKNNENNKRVDSFIFEMFNTIILSLPATIIQDKKEENKNNSNKLSQIIILVYIDFLFNNQYLLNNQLSRLVVMLLAQENKLEIVNEDGIEKCCSDLLVGLSSTYSFDHISNMISDLISFSESCRSIDLIEDCILPEKLYPEYFDICKAFQILGHWKGWEWINLNIFKSLLLCQIEEIGDSGDSFKLALLIRFVGFLAPVHTNSELDNNGVKEIVEPNSIYLVVSLLQLMIGSPQYSMNTKLMASVSLIEYSASLNDPAILTCLQDWFSRLDNYSKVKAFKYPNIYSAVKMVDAT
jgi:hypothetical protein